MILTFLLNACFFALTFAEGITRVPFWHLTDMHYDRNYSLVGDPHNLCHDEQDKQNESYNGLYGNFLCDSPQKLIDITLEFMARQQPNPKFIIWTGDNLPHTRPGPNWNGVLEEISELSKKLSDTFPGIKIYPSIGNHDTYPPNLINPFSNTIYEDYLERGGWKKLLPDDALITFKEGGYYSHIHEGKLKIISLNTILWYSANSAVANVTNPKQLKFLQDELYDSLNKNEKVFIIGHVSPGFYNRHNVGQVATPLYHLQYLKDYLVTIKNYSSVIAGQFFGHIHNDMFQIYQCDTGHAVSSGLLAGSVTPWHSEPTGKKTALNSPVNPSVRLFYYTPDIYHLLDYDQYYLNLSEANMKAQLEPAQNNTYKFLYSFSHTYGVPDLSTESLAFVYEKLKLNDTIFNTFFNYLTAAKVSMVCDDDCRGSQLCSMGATSHDEYMLCMQSVSKKTENNHTVAYAVSFTCIVLIIIILIVIYFYRKKKLNRHHQGYDSYHGI